MLVGTEPVTVLETTLALSDNDEEEEKGHVEGPARDDEDEEDESGWMTGSPKVTKEEG